jgi:Tyrosine-protein kinase ephrin type A/B receptor-like
MCKKIVYLLSFLSYYVCSVYGACCSAGFYGPFPTCYPYNGCPAGSYCGVSCSVTPVICPAGSYCPAGSRTFLYCPLGTYNPDSGVSSISQCQACAPGTYSADDLTECLACPVGTSSSAQTCQYCNIQNGFCPGCSTGTFAGVIGSASCQSCMPGSYTTASGGYVQAGASSCTQCMPGTYQSQSGTTACSSCTAGSYCQSSGMANPTPCPAASFAVSVGQTSSAVCVSCGIGQFAVAGATACAACQNNPGAYTFTGAGENQNSCPLSSTPSCPAGTYARQSSGECVLCAPGSFGSSAVTSWGTSCQACSAETFSAVSGGTVCINCPTGYASTAGASQCTTTQRTSCYGCTPGYFSSAGSAQCQQCAKGSYSSSSSAAVCVSCLSGTTFGDSIGATTCKDCATCRPGKQQPISHSSFVHI